VTESFGRYISAIYADRFDSYDGQKLQVTGEQPAGEARLQLRAETFRSLASLHWIRMDTSPVIRRAPRP